MAIAILMGSGGRGISSDELSATAGNVLTGKTYVGADTNDGIGTGIMPDRGAVSAELAAGGSYAVPEGFHNGSGIITAKSLASQTVGNATESHILSGKKAWVNGSQIIGNIASQAGGTYNPTTSVKTLATGGKYLTSDVKVNGFALPPASALKKGYTYSLYGKSVTGTFEGYTTSPLAIKNGGSKVNSKWTWLAVTGSPYYDSSNAIAVFEGDLVRLQPALNLSEYSQLYFQAARFPQNSSTFIKIGLDPSANKTSISSCKYHVDGDKPSSGAGTTCVYNISSITGSFYLYLGISSGELFYHQIKLS